MLAQWLPEVVVAAILESVSKVELGEREGSEMDECKSYLDHRYSFHFPVTHFSRTTVYVYCTTTPDARLSCFTCKTHPTSHGVFFSNF